MESLNALLPILYDCDWESIVIESIVDSLNALSPIDISPSFNLIELIVEFLNASRPIELIFAIKSNVCIVAV